MTNIDRGAFDQAEYDRRFHGDFMYDATSDDDESAAGRSPLFIILTALVLMAFAAVVWVAYQQGVTQGGDRTSPPTIAREQGPIRIAPENPGGVTVPDQDKQIYEQIAGADAALLEGGAADTLAPAAEEPIDLPAAPAAALAPAAEVPNDVAVLSPEAGVAPSEEAETAQMAATAPPPPEQQEAEAAARDQAAALTAEIEKIDPGAAAAASKQNVAAGAFVVQLGAFKQDSEAAGMWQTIKSKNTEQLGGMKPDIKRVDLGGKGVWYRLRVGPFENRADAFALCQVLKTRGVDCIITAP